MKCLIVLSLSSGILFSCNNATTLQTKHTGLPTTGELIKKMKPIIQGYWVLSNYVKELNSTKSVYESHFAFRDTIHGYYIDTSEIHGDSLVVAATYGDAGPEPYTIYFKNGLSPNSLYMVDMNRLDTAYYNISYMINKEDTVLVIYRYNKSCTKLIDTRKYLKAKTEINGYDTIDGESYFINKCLFSGAYIYTDSTHNKHAIVFNDFGKITGFKNFTRYVVFNDFGQGPPDSDAITFTTATNSSENYFFQIHGDSL